MLAIKFDQSVFGASIAILDSLGTATVELPLPVPKYLMRP